MRETAKPGRVTKRNYDIVLHSNRSIKALAAAAGMPVELVFSALDDPATYAPVLRRLAATESEGSEIKGNCCFCKKPLENPVTKNGKIRKFCGSACKHKASNRRQAAAAHQLHSLHPDFVKVVKKTTKGAWGGGERTDVTVAWKKAYESSQPKRGEL